MDGWMDGRMDGWMDGSRPPQRALSRILEGAGKKILPNQINKMSSPGLFLSSPSLLLVFLGGEGGGGRRVGFSFPSAIRPHGGQKNAFKLGQLSCYLAVLMN